MDLEQETGQNLQNGQVIHSVLIYHYACKHVWINMNSNNYSMLDSDQLISNSTSNKQEEQLHFTMQFSLENNEIILQDYFF